MTRVWTADRELDAAGITSPALRASFAACRALNAQHGRTYFLATLLLPTAKRPAVHALYGFARYELVDDLEHPLSPAQAAARLGELETALDVPSPGEPAVLAAFRHTEAAYAIPRRHTTRFLASMRMDLTVDRYATYPDLVQYMEGSAAAIGLQMLPVLGHTLPYPVVAPYARDLGLAFQLTNFVRDVAEDRRRGRRYIPADSDPRAEVARARALYRSAAQGVRLLDPTSRDCVRAALRLYEQILDRVEAAGFPAHRVTVPRRSRAAVALPGLIRARHSRRVAPTTPTIPASV
jgi:phytoene synthase